MADNLDLKGTVDIDVSGAVRNLEQLAGAGAQLAESLAAADHNNMSGLQEALANAAFKAQGLQEALTEVAMLDMAELGTALSLEREVGLAGNYGEAVRIATGHLQEQQRALLEVVGAQERLNLAAAERAKVEGAAQAVIHADAYRDLEESLQRQADLQYKLNRVRDLGGENAAKFSAEMVAAQEEERKSLEGALEAETRLNEETARRLGIDLTPIVAARQKELETTQQLVEAEQRLTDARKLPREEDAGRVHNTLRAHEEALRMEEKMQEAQRKGIAENERLRAEAHAEALRRDEEELERYFRHQALRERAALQAVNKDRAETLAAQQEAERQYSQLANTRYALQDLAFTWTAVSAATLGAATAAVKLGGDYEKSFRSVQRTTLTMGDAARELKNELVDLTTTIPQQFDDIANIATLGAQMDVPTENLEKFTETVATFSATTDVSVEKTAMSMGRLAQLTKTPIDSIDRLAASVYHVGINSVATEGQILAIAEQIAVSGNLAGLANHEIIGLSAALASLGVQPEAARGAIMRIFNNIRMGVDEGGDALERFASVSGTSAEGFAKAWLDRPQEAFNMFVQGLERVAQEGGSVSGVLKEMGMSNVRDLRVLELLADNTEVYADALADAAQSYGENTALADGYAIEMDNLNDQLTLLMNSFKAMLADIGDMPLLKDLVKWLLQVSEGFRSLLNNPIAGWFAKLTVGLLGLIGGYAAFQAVSVRATASTMGLIQSMRGMAHSVGVVRPGVMGLLDSLVLLNAEQQKIKVSTDRAAVAMRGQGIAARESAAGIATFGTAGQAAAKGMGAATSAVKAFGRATVIIAALSLTIEGLSQAWGAVNRAMMSAEQRFESVIGSYSGLEEAIRADTEIFKETGEGIKAVGYDLDELTDKYGKTIEAQVNFSESGVGVAEVIDETTERVQGQTIALGENAKQWLANALNTNHFAELSRDAIRSLQDDTGELAGIINAMVQDAATGSNEAAGQIVGLMDKINNSIEEQANKRDTLSAAMSQAENDHDALLDKLTYEVELTDRRKNQMITEMEALQDSNRARQEEIDVIEASIAADEEKLAAIDELLDGSDALRAEIERFQVLGELTTLLGLDDVDDAADNMDTLIEKAQDLADAMFMDVNALASVEDALERLGASLHENGDDFSAYTENGRANLQALQAAVNAMAVEAGDDIEVFTENLYALLGALEAQGIDTSEMLGFVHDALLDLTATKYGVDVSTVAARTNLINLLNDAQAVQNLLDEIAGLRRQAASYKGSSVMGDYLTQEANVLQRQVSAVQDMSNAIARAQDVSAKSTQRVQDAVGRGVTNAYNKAAGAAKKAGGAGKKAGKDAAKSAKEAQKEVRTLADYVSDLSSTMNRAFEFRFGVQTSKDATSDIFATIRKNAEDAREAVKKALQDIMDANAKLQSLKADKTILQYQLTVAEEYGDTLRATQIRAELAEKNAEIAKTEKERSDAQKAAKAAQDATSKSLVGNSDAARKNRADILSLVQSYQKQIEALADSGLSSKELQRETERLRQDFIKQTTQLGYSKTEVDKYAKSFSDMSTIIKNVPRNITVNANVGPAQRAINEFLAKKQKAAKIPTTASNPSKANLNNVKKAVQSGLGGVKYRPTLQNPTSAQTKSFGNAFVRGIRTAIAGVRFALKLPIIGKTVANFMGFRSGGFTGRGNLDELAGMVHRGEYVVPAQYVNQATGLPDLNALGQSLGMNTYNSSVSSVTNTTTVAVVELSARDRQLLSRIGDVQINLDNRVLATATNKSNLNTSRRGVG